MLSTLSLRVFVVMMVVCLQQCEARSNKSCFISKSSTTASNIKSTSLTVSSSWLRQIILPWKKLTVKYIYLYMFIYYMYNISYSALIIKIGVTSKKKFNVHWKPRPLSRCYYNMCHEVIITCITILLQAVLNIIMLWENIFIS